jgi:hypothetical protein
VEPLHHPQFDDPMDTQHLEENIPFDNRPIKIKAPVNFHAVSDGNTPGGIGSGGIEDDGGGINSSNNNNNNVNNDPLASTGMPIERFPIGEHPLENAIQGFLELPTPELLLSKHREYCDTHSIIRIFGEYRARCLFSKVWTLRDAVIQKILLMVTEEYQPGDANTYLVPICSILKLAVEDKMQQVLFSSLSLLEQFLFMCKKERLSKTVTMPAFDAMIIVLLDKLADGNARLREGARKGLDIIAAASSLIGPGHVASLATRALSAKQKTTWRPIASRLTLLADLVNMYGLNNTSSGLNMDTLLAFPKTYQAYAHSNVEVRDAAKELVVAIQKQVGSEPLESTLSTLRKKQREEYEAAFAAAAVADNNNNNNKRGGNSNKKRGGGGGGAIASGGGGYDDNGYDNNDISFNTKNNNNNNHNPKQHSHNHNHHPHHHHQTHNPGGRVPTSSARAQDKAQGYEPSRMSKDLDHHEDHNTTSNMDESNAEKQDFTSCMFCGLQNSIWTEAELDLHYWKDCPLLIPCPSCAQIVEIAGLPEHLLDECESKQEYIACDITGK